LSLQVFLYLKTTIEPRELSKKPRIASVVGARPNFMKLLPVHNAIKNFSEHTIIHTGQHYDFELSKIFFNEFKLPPPDYNLDVGSGTSAYQIGEIIKGLGTIFDRTNFDIVIVYGDTNTTMAGALSAKKSGLRVAHVEAGLRSFDNSLGSIVVFRYKNTCSDNIYSLNH